MAIKILMTVLAVILVGAGAVIFRTAENNSAPEAYKDTKSGSTSDASEEVVGLETAQSLENDPPQVLPTPPQSAERQALASDTCKDIGDVMVRSRCYFDLAAKKGDVGLCANVKAQDLINFTKCGCYAEAAKTAGNSGLCSAAPNAECQEACEAYVLGKEKDYIEEKEAEADAARALTERAASEGKVELCYQHTSCGQRNICVSHVADEKLDIGICDNIDESCDEFFDYTKSQCVNSVRKLAARFMGQNLGVESCSGLEDFVDVNGVEVLRKDICLLAAAQEQQEESICEGIANEAYRHNCRIYATIGL